MNKQLIKGNKGFIPIGQIMGVLIAFGIGMVTLVVIYAFGADVTEDIGSDFVANSYGANITDKGLETLDETSDRFGTVGTVIIAVIIIMTLGLFGFMSRN